MTGYMLSLHKADYGRCIVVSDGGSTVVCDGSWTIVSDKEVRHLFKMEAVTVI